MSWRDRDYYQGQGSYHNGGGGMAMGFPKPTPCVKYLLIANIAIFVVEFVFNRQYQIESLFALHSDGLQTFLHPWQFITYQFLHGSTWHIFFNMLGLYFFGPSLERLWGPKRFIFFYLLCGAVGGLAFLGLSTLTQNPEEIFKVHNSLIGASGSVLGLSTACAILLPQMVIILLVFPVPIRTAMILFVVVYLLNIIRFHDLADACHLAGMITAFVYIMAVPLWQKFSRQRSQAKWTRLEQSEETEKAQVDQILEKVHQHGIQSLSRHEKKVLQDATQRQKQRDDYLKRKD